MEFQFIDVELLAEDELLELLDYNARVCAFKRQQIIKMQDAMMISNDIEVPVTSTTMDSYDEFGESAYDDFEEEIDYYLSEFRSLSDEDLDSRCLEVLPIPKNYHYKKIILRLIAEMNRDIKEIREIVLLDENITKRELEEFKSEIGGLQKRIELLKNALYLQEDKALNSTVENQLIFVTTNFGNVRVLEELKSISDSYYEGFLGLFESIKDGTFKNIRRFVNNDNLKGALEVKDTRIRVVFSRLSKNCYAVITAFIKKTMNDHGYRKSMELKVCEYHGIQDALKERLQDEEFLQWNQDVEKELFQLLKKAQIDIEGCNKL